MDCQDCSDGKDFQKVSKSQLKQLKLSKHPGKLPVGAIHPSPLYLWLPSPVRPEHPPDDHGDQRNPKKSSDRPFSRVKRNRPWFLEAV